MASVAEGCGVHCKATGEPICRLATCCGTSKASPTHTELVLCSGRMWGQVTVRTQPMTLRLRAEISCAISASCQ